MKYEAVIGLEVHAELKTKSKIFCSCSNEFGGEPNTRVCPVCLGLPGSLPVMNTKVLEYAIAAGLALNCEIAEYTRFDRKNYFYPDLPKAYQISQNDYPVATGGHLNIASDGVTRCVRINRVHMEEDAGKLVHQGTISTSPYSLVDYNRSDAPLIEIVSEPDMRSPGEATTYLEKLKAILEYTGVSDCKMQEGSLRCDGNISIRPVGSTGLGTKTEVKNMNSFKALQRALEYEYERQIDLVESGGSVTQETRTWDEGKGVTLSMRSKEEAHDYRYFPDPDLPPIITDKAWVNRIRAALPVLPEERKKRYISEYGLSDYDAGVLTSSKAMADYFEECTGHKCEPKKAANWIMGDLSAMLNAENTDISNSPVAPGQLVALLKLIDLGTITGKIAKEVFAEMFATGKDAQVIVREKGLVQISDEGELSAIVDKVLADNPGPVEDYRQGKKRAVSFLVGQVMKATRGKANPQVVNELLHSKL